jgi:predicted GIY-YIG superfamily endonuclease
MPFAGDGSELVVYVLVLKDIDGFYVGMTHKIKSRVHDHFNRIGGQVTSKYGVKGVLSVVRVKDYKEAELVETSTVRELKALGYLCFGPG